MNNFPHCASPSLPLPLLHPLLKNKKVWLGVIGKGPTSKLLDSSFKNRQNPEYKSDLGIKK